MLFDHVAGFISRHAKAIIVLWVIVLALSIWPATQVHNELDYSVSGMSGSDSESIAGGQVIAHYFNNEGQSAESMQLLVIEYQAGDGTQALALGTAFTAALKTYTDASGTVKVTNCVLYGQFEGTDTAGVLLYALNYNEAYTGSIYKDTGNLRALVADTAKTVDMTGVTTYVTGTPAISYDMEETSVNDIKKIDPFSVLLVLLLVGLFFRSLISSAMPPLTIGAAFGVALCALFFLAQAINVFYITEMLILVSMLGAGCDYCIFILSRYREERRQGADHDTALHQAIVWAGESITTSGLAVIIGFGSMAICSFQMISTMGIVLAIGIIMALLAALTLMSSVLALVGDRLFWPSADPQGAYTKKGWFARVGAWGHRYFVRSADFSLKHAKAIIIAAVLFTVPMSYVYLTSESSYDMVGALSNGEAAAGLNAIEDHTAGGIIMPDYAVIETTAALGNVTYYTYYGNAIGVLTWSDDSPAQIAGLNALSDTLSGLDKNVGAVSKIVTWDQLTYAAQAAGATDVAGVIAFAQQAGYSTIQIEAMNSLNANLTQMGEFVIQQVIGTDYQYALHNAKLNGLFDWVLQYRMGGLGGTAAADGSISLTYAKITLITEDQGMSDRSIKTIAAMSDAVKGYAAEHQELIAATWVTGTPAAIYEVSEQVNREFGKVEILAVCLIFVLLFFVMASYLTPLRSILTILMSVVWTVAVTHLLFTSLLGYGVMWLIPIILLVICLGLGMDYDILLTTRIKENHLYRGMSNDDAIRAAVASSGSIITICGFIMGGAFGTLMLSSTYLLQEFGFALMFAILVDALVVRTYIVPAAMHLMGEWNWKGPAFLHRKQRQG